MQLHFIHHKVDKIVPTVDTILDFFNMIHQFPEISSQLLVLVVFVNDVKTFLRILNSQLDNVFVFFFSEVFHMRNKDLVQDLQILFASNKVQEEVILGIQYHNTVTFLVFD